MILSPDLVKDVAPGPERGGGPGVLAGGDGDGLPRLAGYYVEVDLDQCSTTIRPAGTSTQFGFRKLFLGKICSPTTVASLSG